MENCTCDCHRLRDRLMRDLFDPSPREIRVPHMPAECPCVKHAESDEKK